MVKPSQPLPLEHLTMTLDQFGMLYFTNFHSYGHKLWLFACCGTPLYVQRYRGNRGVRGKLSPKMVI